MYQQIHPDDITSIIDDYFVTYNDRQYFIHLLCVAVDQLLAQREQINRAERQASEK